MGSRKGDAFEVGAIRRKAVTEAFDATTVIDGLDRQIDDGGCVVFVGPSGLGKSTRLRLIAGPENVSGGRVLIDGEMGRGAGRPFRRDHDRRPPRARAAGHRGR